MYVLYLLNDRVLYQLTIDFLVFWRQEEANSLQKLWEKQLLITIRTIIYNNVKITDSTFYQRYIFCI